MITNVGIFYFSGTGNTKILAGLLSERFKEKGIKCEVMDISQIIKNSTQPEIDGFDVIGIGYPIYGSNCPKPVLEFIESLKKLNKKAFIFKNGGNLSFNGGPNSFIKEKLKSKDFDIVYEDSYLMPANSMRKDSSELIKCLYNIAVGKTKLLVEDILNNNEKHQDDTTLMKIQAKVVSKVEENMSKNFASGIIVKDNCIKCAKCAKDCPRSNIAFNISKIQFGSDCLMCLKCIYSCPVKALESTKVKNFVLDEFYDFERIISDDSVKANYAAVKETKLPKEVESYLAVYAKFI